MNIGITCYPTYGGSGVVASELGKSLAERGHKIHFISYAMPFRLDGFRENIYYHEVEISSYPLFDFPLYTPALASKIVEVARFEKLDIIHAHYAIPHAISAYLAKQILGDNSIKIVTTLHGTDITLVGLEPSYLPVMKFSIEQSDGVTAVSRFLKEKTLTSYQIKKPISVIPNFVDCSKYVRVTDDHVRRQFAPNNEKILIHISNFRPLKRVGDVIRIFNIVRQKVKSKLLLVGDGPDRSIAEQLARELGIVEDIKFLGKQAEIIPLLSIADLFLIPSQSESFGLSALEAMACEVPVVASSVGGLPEVVIHGTTGFISEIGDVERMAKYSVELLTNETKHKMFASASRKRAVEEFEVHGIVSQYENLYEKILDDKTYPPMTIAESQ
ncbi:MAG: N-acetyl-alpha-D-glucosaminyl L-malate synthase BshA [Chlorobiaceae bacterium]|nr:N-acetyl-alpha-D-glucosaminyl L-malate synthase BshA [Chlorobiaceae bacterium]